MKILRYLFIIIVVAIMMLVPSCKAMPDHPPIIMSLRAEPEAVLLSESCQIECTASDDDGDELSYEWLASEGKIDGSGAMVTWTAPEAEGLYNIEVIVTDSRGGEVTDYVTIPVKVNRPPIINSLIANADWVAPSGGLQVKCDAEDPDGDGLSYEWTASGGEVSGSGAVVNWAAPGAAGMYDIQVVVTDSYGAEDTLSLTVSVAPITPPVIEDLIVTAEHKYLKEYLAGYKIGKEKNCDIECIVSDTSSELFYEWTCDYGQISGEGSVVTWTAPNTSGDVAVTVTVSDAAGNMVSKSIVFRVVTCSTCTFG
jgi:hypothetical protein